MPKDHLNISDIQHFSVGDGPGIRTTVFLKGCNLDCPWCHNPEAKTARRVVMDYPNAHKTIVSGREMPVPEVADEVLADLDFYADGGGLTVSGGECLLDPDGTAELLKAVRSRAEAAGRPLTTLIDTAGCVEFSAFEAVDPYTDIYFIDIKTADAEKYRSIGGDLRLLSDNIRKLTVRGRNVRVRVPLIPGFNTSEGQLEAIAKLTISLGAESADLLPFHRLGSGKYKALGLDYEYAGTQPLTPAEADGMGGIFRAYGLKIRIER